MLSNNRSGVQFCLTAMLILFGCAGSLPCHCRSARFWGAISCAGKRWTVVRESHGARLRRRGWKNTARGARSLQCGAGPHCRPASVICEPHCGRKHNAHRSCGRLRDSVGQHIWRQQGTSLFNLSHVWCPRRLQLVTSGAANHSARTHEDM